MTPTADSDSRPVPAPPRPAWGIRTLLPAWLALAVLLPLAAADRYLLGADSGHYVELAGALSHGEPYEVNGRPETKYPPGFPLLLTPAGLVARNDFAIASAWAAFLASFVLLLAAGWAARQGSEFPFALGLATIASATFLRLATGNPMADLAYMGLSLGFLLWGRAWYADSKPLPWRSALAGGALLVATVATRTVGIAAVGAYGAAVVTRALLRRPGWRATARDVLPLALAGGYLAAWFWWTTTMRQPWYAGEYMDSYLHQLVLVNPHEPALGRASVVDLGARVLSGFRIQAAHAGELLTQLPRVEPSWFSPLVVLPVGLVLAGLVRGLRRGDVLVPAYLAAYVAVVLAWPFDEGRRFLLPILPLLLYYGGNGAGAVLDAIRRGHRALPRWQLAVSVLGATGALATILRAPGDASTQEVFSFASWAALLVTVPLTHRPAVRAIARTVGNRRPALVAALVLVFAAAGTARTLPVIAARARTGAPDDPTAVALERAADWLRGHTARSAVVQATFVGQLHVASRRRVVPLPLVTAPEVYREIDRRYAPTHLVVLDPVRHQYYRPTDRERLEVLRRALHLDPRAAYAFPGGTIYTLPRRDVARDPGP